MPACGTKCKAGVSNILLLDCSPTYSLTAYRNLLRLHFNYKKEIQASHEKGKSTYHENLLKPQKYMMTHKLTNKQKSLLFNLRCQSVRGVRQNFSKQYYGDIQCRLCKFDIWNSRTVSPINEHVGGERKAPRGDGVATGA